MSSNLGFNNNHIYNNKVKDNIQKSTLILLNQLNCPDSLNIPSGVAICRNLGHDGTTNKNN